jgi:hypothetical protein
LRVISQKQQFSANICGGKIDSEFLLSGQAISGKESQRLLLRQLGNASLECWFLNCSKMKIRATLFDFRMEKRIDLESTNLLSLLVEALNSLLLNDSVSIESKGCRF